jgi:Na+-translocating ferredoxin:NAD+ oxidoreductase subunit G
MKSILTALVFTSSVASFAGEIVKFNDFLKSELSASAKTAKETFTLTPEQKTSLKSVAEDSSDTAFTFFYGKTSDGKIEKSCTVVPQKGKEGPMSVGVCFGQDGLVNSLIVLAHEEERGKKAAEGKDFIKQFKGKKASSPFQVGKDVDAVTGATVTSKALSEAVRKASFAYTQFVEKKK